MGLHIGGGFEGNAGFDPDGKYGKDCDGDGGDCSYDWSLGLGGELQIGVAGAGGSVSEGSTGASAIGDIPVLGGLGIGADAGVEACLIITCPINL